MNKSRSSATKKNSGRRVRETPTTARFDVSRWPDQLVLLIDDVVTKNERHRAVTIHGSVAAGTKDRASVIESDLADRLKAAVLAAFEAVADRFSGFSAGAWRLDVLTVWPTQRHLHDGLDLPFGDADSALSLIRDALQHAGVVDNDIRIVCDRTVHRYEKGQRRTVARLTLATAADLALADELLALERVANLTAKTT